MEATKQSTIAFQKGRQAFVEMVTPDKLGKEWVKRGVIGVNYPDTKATKAIISGGFKDLLDVFVQPAVGLEYFAMGACLRLIGK